MKKSTKTITKILLGLTTATVLGSALSVKKITGFNIGDLVNELKGKNITETTDTTPPDEVNNLELITMDDGTSVAEMFDTFSANSEEETLNTEDEALNEESSILEEASTLIEEADTTKENSISNKTPSRNDRYTEERNKPTYNEDEKTYQNNSSQSTTENKPENKPVLNNGEPTPAADILNDLRDDIKKITNSLDDLPTSDKTIDFIENSSKGITNDIWKKIALYGLGYSVAGAAAIAAAGITGGSLNKRRRRNKADKNFIRYNIGEEFSENVINLLKTQKVIRKNEERVLELEKIIATNPKNKVKFENELEILNGDTETSLKSLKKLESNLTNNIYSITSGKLTTQPEDIRSQKYLHKYLKNNAVGVENIPESQNSKISKKLSAAINTLNSLTASENSLTASENSLTSSDTKTEKSFISAINKKRKEKAQDSIKSILDTMPSLSGGGKVIFNDIINNKDSLYSSDTIKRLEDLSKYLNISDRKLARKTASYILLANKGEQSQAKGRKRRAEKQLSSATTLKKEIKNDPTFNKKYFGHKTTINNIPINSSRYILANNLSAEQKEFFDAVYFTQLHRDKANYETTLNIKYNDSQYGSFVCSFDNKEGLDLMMSKFISTLPVKNIEKIELVEKVNPRHRLLKTTITEFDSIKDMDSFNHLYTTSVENVKNFENMFSNTEKVYTQAKENIEKQPNQNANPKTNQKTNPKTNQNPPPVIHSLAANVTSTIREQLLIKMVKEMNI